MPKKVLICCDKYKGSLRAIDVCKAIAKGILMSNIQSECIIHPMADGGDGSLSVVKSLLSTKTIFANTFDSLGRPIKGHYQINKQTAFIELAVASGLAGLTLEERNPLITSTYGTGLLIKDALSKNVKEIVLFLGGSSTNDAGLGICTALGFKFLNDNGAAIEPAGGQLSQIASIIPPNNLPTRLIKVLCDVDNTFYGPTGAAAVFSVQKGASPEQVVLLDQGLKHLNSVFIDQYNINLNTIPGSGSAGGVAGGLHTLLGASIESGFDLLSQLSNLEQKIISADLVITGEGQLDIQSLEGKVVGKVAELCLKHKKRLVAIVGNNTLQSKARSKSGIEKILAIREITSDFHDAMKNAAQHIERLAKEVF